MATEKKLGTGTSGGNTYLMVPILIFFGLLIFAVIRGPNLISPVGIGSAVIVVAPLVLATYALTIICIAGRASVDLSIGPLIGFINVSLIQLHGIGFMESPIAVFLYAMGVGVAYQILQGLIIIFVRVQPIIVSLSGYLALVGLNLVILPRPGGVAPPWMFDWGSGTTLFSAVLVILAIATAAWYILAQTSFFGHLKMMGRTSVPPTPAACGSTSFALARTRSAASTPDSPRSPLPRSSAPATRPRARLIR